MAVYKVPQDVEADDKLLGPFSFRQFIYLVVVAVAGVAAWGLSKLLLPLAIIPVPIMLVFLILALPLRKDQPMEIYAAAVVSFFLKPRKRIWQPDGIVSLIEVSAPIDTDLFLGKGLSQDEASQRLSYLSQLVDTQGWAVRGVNSSPTGSSMQDDALLESQSAEDVLDETNQVSQSLEARLTETDQRRRQTLLQQFQSSATAEPQADSPVEPTTIQQPVAVSPTPPAPITQSPPPAPTSEPAVQPTVINQSLGSAPVPQPATQAASDPGPAPVFNPYPSAIRQSVIHPVSSQPPIANPTPEPAPEPPPRKDTPHPDIINLASNSDLSVETIAREAKRIKAKYADDEIVLQLH